MNKKQTKKEDKFSKILNKLNEIGEIRKIRNEIKDLQSRIENYRNEIGEMRKIYDSKLEESLKILSQLAGRSVDQEERLNWLKENMFTKEDGQKILNAIDSFSGDVSRLDQENIVGSRIIKRINDDMREQKEITDRHEKEIQKLKAKAAV